MTFSHFKKILVSILLLGCVYLSYAKTLDMSAENVTESGIKRALITYAVARGLNGVISVAQGTEVALSPAGVGLTLAPGQILDPVNDLVERFSWVVMMSATSLGIQRLFIEISSSIIISSLLFFFSALYLVSLFGVLKQFNLKMVKHAFLKKSIVFILLVRFSVPLVALMSDALYLTYMQPQFIESQKILTDTSITIESINQTTHEELDQTDKGFIDKMDRWLHATKKNLNVSEKMELLKSSVEKLSEKIINLIVVFIVQTIVFPLLFLWLLITAGKWLIRSFTIL